MSGTQGKNGGGSAENAWVETVLGFRFDQIGAVRQALTAQDVRAWRQACGEFQGAVDTVSAQIEALREAVGAYGRQVDDEELIDLARRSDFGINGFTQNTFVRLRKALLQAMVDEPAKLKRAVPAVVTSAAAMQSALESSEEVEAADDNPFEVRVDIAGTLVPALARLVTIGSDLAA